MDFVYAPGPSVKLRGKRTVIGLDPVNKTGAVDGAILLHSNKLSAAPAKLERLRLIINGPGDYEIGGVKISATRANGELFYGITMDGVAILVTKASSLEKVQEKLKESHVLLLYCDGMLNQAVVTALDLHVLILYGDKATENAKVEGKDVLPVSKYTTSREKLPDEMEVVVLG